MDYVKFFAISTPGLTICKQKLLYWLTAIHRETFLFIFGLFCIGFRAALVWT